MTRLLLIVLLALLPLCGQPPRGFFAWWDSPVVRDLNLTADQQNQIRSTVREYRTRLIDLRAEAEKAEVAMEEAFNEEPFDQRRANEAIERVVTARGELTRTLSQMGVRLRATLTPDQWRELQKRREAMQERIRERVAPRMMRKQGNPGGPPQGPPPQEE